MISHLYFEEEIEGHPRAEELFARFPKARRIPCSRYKEVFNPSGQNFRLQKKKPALILASQKGIKLHRIPPKYGVGGSRNFYFSHLLNCLYDCRYCFLQGMFPSAHYVLFLNYEDFWSEILKATEEGKKTPSWFFSGYDCDSLALESVTGFADFFLPLFAALPEARLELRTKSINTKVLKSRKPVSNVVVAFSFTPDEISERLENGVPAVDARIRAMHELADLGWSVGVRIDPIIECLDFKARYARLLHKLFAKLPSQSLHSVSLGTFRMPRRFFKKVEKLYPDEPLFAGSFDHDEKNSSYLPEIERSLMESCRLILKDYVEEGKIFACEII